MVRDKPTIEMVRQVIRLFPYDATFMTQELLEQCFRSYLPHPEHVDSARNLMVGDGGVGLPTDPHKFKANVRSIFGGPIGPCRWATN